MLSRKNKELKTIKEGVVGKYVKKDTPPEMPSILCQSCITLTLYQVYIFIVINVWTTEPKRKLSNNQRSSISNLPLNTQTLPQSSTIQKFGNLKTMISEVGLGSHEGKYTPSSSVSNLSSRFGIHRVCV